MLRSTGLLQNFHSGTGVRGPDVIWSHGLPDRLVGIAQERPCFGTTFVSAHKGLAKAAGQDRVLNLIPAMFAIELQRTAKFVLSQIEFSGGHVDPRKRPRRPGANR
jgi:hypothetical protein